MDIAAVATSLQQTATANAIGIAVLKKAMAIESQTAQALLQALPQPTPSSPPHLGAHIDVKV